MHIKDSGEVHMNLFTRISNALNNVPEIAVYIVFAFVMLVKGCYYGFAYNPVLDDFIQYHANTLYNDPFNDVIIGSGLLSGRPLAGLFDLYFWSGFWDNLAAANIIITLLYTASGILIYRIFHRHFKITPVFLFIYGLLPVGSEAANWLSASSRLIVPMFFLGLSLTLIQACFDVKNIASKAVLCVFGTIFLFASMAFYEQTAVLAFIIMCALILINKRGFFHYLIVVLPSALIGYFYFFTDKASLYTARINIIDFSVLPYELFQHLMSAGSKIFYVLFNLNMHVAKNSFEKGFEIIKNEKNISFFILMIIAATAVFIITALHAKKQNNHIYNDMPNVFVLLFSILLIFAPMSLFLVIQNPWISMRNVFPAILGIALFLDLIFKWVLYNKYLRSAVISVLCLLFITANVAELTDYYTVGSTDIRIAENTANTLLNEQEKLYNVVVLGTKDSYVNVAVMYNEHINNVTSSNWAYEGAVSAIAGTIDVPHIYPLHEGLVADLYPNLDLDIIDAYYYMDESFNLHKLTAVPYNENFSLYDGDILYAEVLRWNNQDPTIKIMANE